MITQNNLPPIDFRVKLNMIMNDVHTPIRKMQEALRRQWFAEFQERCKKNDKYVTCCCRSDKTDELDAKGISYISVPCAGFCEPLDFDK